MVLTIMLSMGEEVRSLGYEQQEVKDRVAALVNTNTVRTRSRSGIFTGWGCDMDFTALARQKNCLVVVVSVVCITAHPPSTSSMSLSSLPDKCPHLLKENPRCIILAHLGQCHFKPVFAIDAPRRRERSFANLPRLLDLNIPAPTNSINRAKSILHVDADVE